MNTNKTLVLFGIVLFFGCIKNRDFDAPGPDCTDALIANTTYREVKNLYEDATFQIQEDLIIEGYVVSSDEQGNFFSVLHFQDAPLNPSEGFQMEIDVRDSHLFYPVGSKIFIKLKGLYLGKSKDVFKLGGTFTSFGNVSIGRLPAAIIDRHIFVSCEENAILRPTEIAIGELTENRTNTLVRFSGVEFVEKELGESFSVLREETERTLTDCDNNELVSVNSGFSDFQAEELPAGNGTITGVLLRERNDFKLAIRNLNDIDFFKPRCTDEVTEFSSSHIFISELADPENNSKARFVELYNSSEGDVSLNGWTLRRYTNANTEVGSTIDLSEHIIEPNTTLVISPNAVEFEAVYGFLPDIEAGGNSPADSNGDDNLQLVDPFGNVVDAFGVVGEDGSGTNHEFQNGRALRKTTVQEGNPVYTFDEWIIYNDTGDSGTMLKPQLAPEDFSPGTRN